MEKASALQAEDRWFKSNREYQLLGEYIMRIEVSETVYYYDYCNEMYAVKEDCELCEDACKMLAAIKTAIPALAEDIENLNGNDKYKAANIIKIYKNL